VASRVGVQVILTGMVEYGIEGEPYAVSSWFKREKKGGGWKKRRRKKRG
jgi:hypothetical protein